MGFQQGAGGARGPAGGPRKPSLLQAFESLRYGSYRTLWISQLFSFMGMQMQMVARGLLAFELAGTNTAVGITMVAWGLPQLVFSLVGGAVADRVDKRNVILISQLGTGLLSLFNAVLITTGYISIPWLFVLGVAQGTLFAFNMPARQAFVAELVPQSSLMNAIALNNVGMNATRVVAPAAAGIMIGLWGIESAYYTQSVMLLVVVGLTLVLPKSRAHLEGAAQRKGIFQEIGIGLQFIASSRTMMLLMLMAFVPTLIGMPYMTLLPGFRDELALSSQQYGLMFTVTGVGAVVGSVAIAALTDFSRKPLLQAVMGLGYGLSLAALGLGAIAAGYSGTLVALLLLGLFSTTYQTLNNTMVMAETRPEFYGRVMSVYMLTFSLFPLMSAPMGIVADRISATTTFVVLGTLITAFIVLTILLAPRYTFRRQSAAERRPQHGPRPTNDAAPPPPSAEEAPVLPVQAPLASRTATAALAAGDAALSRGRRPRSRVPRRDYLGSPSSAPASPPDYMAGQATDRLEAESPRFEALPFPPAGTYGLVSRGPEAQRTATSQRSYGLDVSGSGSLRAVGGTGPIEAGDSVSFAVLPVLEVPALTRGSQAGRFLPSPIEQVTVPSATPRADASSRPMFVAALTAAVSTSVLSLFVRRGGNRPR
ncbi:MAG: MFS transporter [Dehalococcoidia bacterium]|nr:MFS transporter [Dehalococcoidia bacterium]